MKKLSFYIKLLMNFLILSIVFNLILMISKLSKIALIKFGLINSKTIEQNNYTSQIIFTFIGFALLIYLLSLFIKFRKVVYLFNKSSFFSKKNANTFHIVGTGLIYYSIGKFILKFIEMFVNRILDEESVVSYLGVIIGESLANQLLVLMMALFILIIAQLIKDGYQLKNENDLTI